MVKDFICRLQEENQDKIEKIEQEMMDLSSQLEASECLLAELQQEKSVDQTIFSPRAMDADTDKKIEEKKQEIEQLKRRLDYVGQMREAEIQNRREYQSLADEIDQSLADNNQKDNSGRDDSGDSDVKEQNASANIQDSTDGTQELLAFLNSSCKKIEYSLSLVSGNKNRCKSELRNLLQSMRSYIQKVQNKA